MTTVTRTSSEDALGAGVRPRPVFVGGCPRSGTTLLGAMLGVGPTRITVPEAMFKFRLLAAAKDGRMTAADAVATLQGAPRFDLWRVPVPRVDELAPDLEIRALLSGLARDFGRRTGKPDADVWIDHTPGNIRFAGSLARLFPDAKFINIVRDGRGVAASVLGLDWGPNRIEEAATWWGTHVALGLAAERLLGPQLMRTVRFEDLLADPEHTLRELCSFLGTPYDEEMITRRDYKVASYTVTDHVLVSGPPDSSRSEAWRSKLTAGQIEEFEYRTGELAQYLGYPAFVGSGARPSPRGERFRRFVSDVARRGVIDPVRRRASERRPRR